MIDLDCQVSTPKSAISKDSSKRDPSDKLIGMIGVGTLIRRGMLELRKSVAGIDRPES
jgi:hypothetical protein